MPDIPKLVQSIESGRYDDKQLVNLYRNTEKYDSITEGRPRAGDGSRRDGATQNLPKESKG